MKVLCVGDVVGKSGCELVRRVLPGLKRQYGVDVCIVNGENSADGNGIVPASADSLLDSGADVITGGNHTFRRREYYERLERDPMLLRPANYPASAPGSGMYTVDRGRYSLTVINLIGVVYMEALADPFDTLDALLRQAGNPKFCVVDFHAEATAEKKALAYYADGRISALFGTHTHVPTADEQILPGGTGFITDVGMSGPAESVLGVRPELSIRRMHDKLPVRFVNADGVCELQAALFTLDDATGRAVAVERIAVRG